MEILTFGRVVRLEPEARVAAGDDVLLDAEIADVERVQDVFTAHDELDWAARWNVEVVARRAVWILELPVPLRRGHIDLIGVVGHRLRDDESLKANEEDEHDDDRWDDRPTEFEHRVVVRTTRVNLTAALAVLPHEDKHDADDEDEEEVIDVVDEVEDPIDLRRDRGRTFREPERLGRDRQTSAERWIVGGLREEGWDHVQHFRSPSSCFPRSVNAGQTRSNCNHTDYTHTNYTTYTAEELVNSLCFSDCAFSCLSNSRFLRSSVRQNAPSPSPSATSVTAPPIVITLRACST